jgi:hypothetical protein
MWANFQRILELFTQKIVTKLSKIWVQGSKRHRIPDPQHCLAFTCPIHGNSVLGVYMSVLWMRIGRMLIRIRPITLMRIRIQIFYLMRIRIRLFTLMRIRIQIIASKKGSNP